jgi:hypothetical protein
MGNEVQKGLVFFLRAEGTIAVVTRPPYVCHTRWARFPLVEDPMGLLASAVRLAG